MAIPRTTFILGAGASNHLNYPTGAELRKLIVHKMGEGKSDLYDALKSLDASDTIIKKIRDIIYYADFDSIDEVLFQYRDDPKVIIYGKAAIAFELNRHEHEHHLFGAGNPGWYKSLFRFLHKNPAIVDEQAFSFITFNYDRSLDFYLERALIHSRHSGEGRQKVLNFLQSNITHMHGQLGYLEWQTHSGPGRFRSYSQKMETASELIGIAGSIILPHETNPNTVIAANGYLEHADKVCVLGYGYHEANNNKLGLPKLREMHVKKVVYTTLRDPSASAAKFVNDQLKPEYALPDIQSCVDSVLNTYNS